MIEIDVGAVLIGMGLGIGMFALYLWYLYNRLKSRIDHMVQDLINEAEVDLVGLEIEVDKGVYFCYNTDTKQFVCQGSTINEIRQAFQQRFPGKTAYLAGGSPAVVEQFRSESTQLKTNENSTSQ
jgi:hypothetical protein